MAIRILEDFFRNLVERFTRDILKSVESNFIEGSIRILNMAKRKDLKPIPPTKKEKENLSDQISENIKGVTDDLNKQIKNEIRNSILNQETNAQLAKRLDGVFKGKNATKINYEARLKMIAVTERSRILNASSMKTAKRLGFTHKYIDIVRDKKTAGDSFKMFAKYGSPEKAIPIDQDFVITYQGREQRGLYPPLRPNDRELILFTNKEE